MRLSWAQIGAGALALVVVAGLLLLPGRLLGPDRPAHVGVPLPQTALRSVEAVPPVRVVKRHQAAAQKPALVTGATTRVTTPAVPARTTTRISPARKLVQSQRSAVIRRLAPRAPLVGGRQIASVPSPSHTVRPAASSTAKTIAALAAGLHK